ncbi:MAG TPA: HAD family phosphatase [Actinomycetota bacterium]|nr:HAD family phosphatase [Actinomycetota bacterium]
MPERYRGLVIDFGGVLTTSIAEAFRAFCEREGIEHDRLKAILRSSYAVGTDPDAMVAMLETGRLERTEFEQRLAAVLSEGLASPLDHTDLLARMLGGIRFDVPMVEAVHAARGAGVRTAMLSNSWGVEGYPRPLLDVLFDHVVISGEVGMRKPDEGVFKLTARRLGLPPGDCAFVDDVRGNVEAAEAVGMRGVLHEDARRTIPQLEALLGIRLDRSDPGLVDTMPDEALR